MLFNVVVFVCSVGLVEEKKNRLEKEDAMRRAAMNNKMHHRLERLNCTDVQKHVAESEQVYILCSTIEAILSVDLT